MSRSTARKDPWTPRWRCGAAALVASSSLFMLKSALAAHLLMTEDTGTQGVGNAELEIGLEDSRKGDDRVFTLQPQLSYGARDDLDLIVQPAWSEIRHPEFGERGFGDTGIDFKWRFLDSAPLSMALRAGLLVPAGGGNVGEDKSRTSAHAVFVAEADLQPWTLQANVGYSTDPGLPSSHGHIARVSGAVLYALDEKWTLCLDAGLDPEDEPHESSWKNTWVAGVIYKVAPALEFDAGLLVAQSHDRSVRQLLFGVTYRWRP